MQLAVSDHGPRAEIAQFVAEELCARTRCRPWKPPSECVRGCRPGAHHQFCVQTAFNASTPIQKQLLALYDMLFSQYSIATSQVLVLASDFKEVKLLPFFTVITTHPCGVKESRRDGMRTTLSALMRLGVIPVLNENDAVGAPADSNVFTDNDSLAALIGSEMNADCVLLLTDVDGLFTHPPGHPESRLISAYTPSLEFNIGSKSAMGRGGMGAKIKVVGLVSSILFADVSDVSS